jgi:hypothetical protein
VEAPLSLLIPQYLLIAGILLMSFFPKLLIGPISDAIDPDFASTLVWEGMSLELIYGSWNPVPTMAVAVAVSAALFLAFWLLRRSDRNRSAGTRASGWGDTVASFYAFYQAVFATLTPPLARAFWDSSSAGTMALADRTRKVYNGDGQLYCLYILYFFIALYVASSVLQHM